MFSGIVEGKRPVRRLSIGSGGLELVLDLGSFGEGVRPGDSIAVLGCCLTVTELHQTDVHFHVMGQTLSLTRFRSLKEGDEVNIERSLRVGDRIGGHFVTGHLDGVGEVLAVADRPSQWDLTVEVPEALAHLVVPKGSVTLDGVSLTVAHLEGRRVTVCLIPYTLEHTTLGSLRAGDQVHLEMDMIGKWVRTLAGPYLHPEPS